ncbi:MAG: FkbM family methyltransferase [Alphaproteobacteria bacterium]|nr:FkbM family methyltransferase [Alphaproteobacteria bacterium]
MVSLKSLPAKLAHSTGRVACLNAFVYYRTIRSRIRLPDIPVCYAEQYGQCGEDLIAESIIRARAFSDGTNATALRYLEIGGNHPFATSATYLLHTRLGMTGVIVEANGKLVPALRKGRPCDTVVHAAVTDSDEATAMLSVSRRSELSSLDRGFVLGWANGRVGEARIDEVPAIRINQIVERYMGASTPCFMSIDVEGLDLRLLKDFDFRRYRPWLLQVEPSDHHVPGNSGEIYRFMRSVGYRLIAKTAVNMIFET